jgi:hypothetical protein
MSISHRTNRLKLLSTPSVEQLQNGRYRLTVNCTTLNSRDDWYSANKDRIFPDFGSLQSAEMSIDGLAPRVGEAYANMRLTSVQSDTRSLTNGGDYIVVLTYETIGNTFVQVKDDTTDYKTNGLRTVSRSIIAEPGTSYAQTIGESFIDHQINTETAVRCYLASYKIDDTDSYRGVEEVYIEAGILSETLDSVGSQQAKVIESIGPDPATPSGYVLASKQESDFEGFQTNRFTFLKPDVELSNSEDNVGSQLAVIEEWFKPVLVPAGTAPDRRFKTGYSLAKEELSDVGGIPTARYTFLKDNVQLSGSIDKVGSQLTITEEWFNPLAARKVKANYSLAKEEASDVTGIPTVRYSFLKDDVELSRSEDKVGSQLAITTEVFNPTEEPAIDEYVIANVQESDIGGIPTKRYTFLKENVELSRSEDLVGSQLAIVTEVFNPEDNPEEEGYSIARTEISDVDGIPTKRFTLLKDDAELSRSEDLVGSQLAIVTEVFNPSEEPTIDSYVLARTEVSDVDGIPTKRYTFLKENVELSRSEDLVGSQLSIVTEVFNPTEDPVEDGYVLARTEISDVVGIPTKRFTFLKDNVKLSESSDKVGSQLAKVEEWFNPTEEPVIDSYVLANTQVSDVEGIPTKRYTFLKDNVKLSQSEDNVGSQLAIVQEWFNPTEEPVIEEYIIANTQVSDVGGIPTNRYTFLKDNVELSRSEDKVGSQLAIVTEVFNPTEEPAEEGYSLARTEVSDVDGIPTKRFTFLKDNVELSRSEDNVGSQVAIVTEIFNPEDEPTEDGYSLARTEASDVDGIQTKRYTFLKDDVELSRSEDKVGSQLAIVTEVFNPAEEPVIDLYVLANTQVSDVEGIPTKRYTFLKENVELSRSEDLVGSQLAIVTEVFNPTEEPTIDLYVLARTEVSDVDGIPTKRYTFLKENVELSRNEDLVGSQLAIVTEVFKATEEPTIDSYVLANTQISDVDGIPTKRFTFLKENVELSRSEDKVGSQLAIVTEVFNPTEDPVEADYDVARIEISDVDGIPTKRFTFLKPSIISVRQNLNDGERLVSVEAFSQTTTQVEEALSEITVDHRLISKSESDYGGIKTSTYVYQIDSSYKEEYEVNGFRRIILTELATVAFTAAAIGSAAPAAVGADLFLASQTIDNGGVIKVKESVFIEAGVISVTPMEEDGFSLAASYVYVTTNAPASEMTGLITPSGASLPASVTWYEPSVQNIEGYPTYTQKVILKTVPNGNAGVLVHSTQKFFTVTEPGVMGCDGAYSQSAESGAAARYPVATKAPRTYRKKATVNVYLTVSGDISEAEVAFSEEGVDWCSVAFDSFYTSEEGQAASATGSWRSFPNYLKGSTNGQAEATLLGKYAAFANSYGFGSTTYVQAGIYRVEVDKYTRSADGTQLYLKTIVTF